MKKIEFTLAAIGVFSILYKLLIGGELNILLIISLIGLSLFYSHLSFLYFNDVPLDKVFKKRTYQKISTFNIIGTAFSGLGMGITILGILWSLMQWPFNDFFLIGIPIVIIAGLTAFIKYTIHKYEGYIPLIERILIIGIIGSAFWINPNNAFSQKRAEVIIPELHKKHEMEELSCSDRTLKFFL